MEIWCRADRQHIQFKAFDRVDAVVDDGVGV
jgi:hypothetical protein